ncbi:MAG: hypothetical protein E7337_13570 [Clostridiales bacterium]|nr:hypothetical protein [Clostridiales bacterium]
MGDTNEALEKWQAIGKRIKRVRHAVGMTTAAFANEAGTSTLNINLIENLLHCDKVMLREPEALAREMSWDALLERVSYRFVIPEDWLRKGEGKEPISTIGKNDDHEDDYEFVVSVPLMISHSALLEATDMIVDISSSRHARQMAYHRINPWLYRTLTDLFILYYQGMHASGRADIAGQTTKAMLNAIERNLSFAESAFVMDADG